jgi:hypothetical protein
MAAVLGFTRSVKIKGKPWLSAPGVGGVFFSTLFNLYEAPSLDDGVLRLNKRLNAGLNYESRDEIKNVPRRASLGDSFLVVFYIC